MKRGLTTWENGLLIKEDFEEIECSGCLTGYRFDSRGRYQRVERAVPAEIRFFKNTHGYLCIRCFGSAKLCECGDLITVRPENKCRNCFMGEEEKRPFGELLHKR